MSLNTELLIDGNFTSKDIILVSTDEYLNKYEPSLESKLEQLWQEKLLDAKKNGYELWNSQSYALKDQIVKDNKLQLTIGLVEYKYQTGIAQFIKSGEISTDFATHQMYSSLLIRTSDGQWVFGIGAKHVYVGEIKYVGGSYSRDENVLKDGDSLFRSATRELEEELGITENQISSISLRRIYATVRGMRSFVFVVELNIDADSVRKAFRQRQDQELADIRIFDPTEARKIISNLRGSMGMLADLIY